jgi:hypothetical protein
VAGEWRLCVTVIVLLVFKGFINALTPKLNPSAQRCLTRFLNGDFAS